MRRARVATLLGVLLGILALGALVVAPRSPASDAVPGNVAHARSHAAARLVPVTISGGYATDPRDHGRPVVLVAAALGVPTEVFRLAFSGVTPAAAGHEPDPAQVKLNKQALLKVLAPYGVTNEALDTASNYYRFNGSAGQTWPRTPATASAIVKNGKVVSFAITRAGAGYSSTPVVTVPGFPATRVKVTVAYGKDLATNGSVSSLAVIR